MDGLVPGYWERVVSRVNGGHQKMYECHITMVGEAAHLESVVKFFEWHFSKIDGDPVLGKGIKCYATKNYTVVDYTLIEVIQEMERIARGISNQGINIVRTKVEQIVYDTCAPKIT